MIKKNIYSYKNTTRLAIVAFATSVASLAALEKGANKPEEKKQPTIKIIPMPLNGQNLKGYLGILGKPIDEVVAEQLNIKNGISLKFVKPGGPAALAGIKRNDILIKIDEKIISQQEDVNKALNGKKPGQKMNLEIISKGKKSIIPVKLGTPPKIQLQLQPAPKAEPQDPPKAPDAPKKELNEFEGVLELKIEGEALLPDNQGKGKAQRLFELNLGKNGKITKSHTVDPKTGNKYTHRKTKDGREVDVHDKKGKLLYSGPYNNQIDKASVPEEYRTFLNSIQPNEGNALKLEIK